MAQDPEPSTVPHDIFLATLSNIAEARVWGNFWNLLKFDLSMLLARENFLGLFAFQNQNKHSYWRLMMMWFVASVLVVAVVVIVGLVLVMVVSFYFGASTSMPRPIVQGLMHDWLRPREANSSNYPRHSKQLSVTQPHTIGASIIKIGLWGPLYYTYNKEPPQKTWYRKLFRPLYCL